MDFNSILIGSENPEALVAYYTKLLGDPAFAEGGYTAWQLGSGWVTVGPHSDVKGRNAAPGRIIWNIETKDVVGDFERMKAAGAIVIAEPYGFDSEGQRSDEPSPEGAIATFADPDDNYFQLMTPMGM